MKTKLYKRFIKRVCKLLKISKKQLFNRDFKPVVMRCYKFNPTTKKIDADFSQLILLERHHPLAQLWDAFDTHTAWLFKYWRHSHWKSYVQMKLDLGFKLDDILIEVLDAKG